jgi:hypothetical protein
MHSHAIIPNFFSFSVESAILCSLSGLAAKAVLDGQVFWVGWGPQEVEARILDQPRSRN